MNGPYWIGYDNPESFAKKAGFVNLMDIGGAMVWSLDTDDFGGYNSEEPYPLLQVSFIFILISRIDNKKYYTKQFFLSVNQ